MPKESKVRSIPFAILFPVLTNLTTTADSCTLILRYASVRSVSWLTFQPLHLPSIYIYALWCWGVIRYAKLVLYIRWSSSGYAQFRLGCKNRRPSTSDPIVEDRNLILPKTLSPLEKFFYIFRLGQMARSILLFSYPGDIFTMGRLRTLSRGCSPVSTKKNSKTSIGITAILPPFFPFTGQLNTITNTVIRPISSNNTLSAPLNYL